ncbi:MAG TPA: hypothetical protein VG248_17180 [Caulobacteraceae bacterium]|jgi:hypothetical protein|nr:hypothetical protein [Caulobacteraceae bacterium]
MKFLRAALAAAVGACALASAAHAACPTPPSFLGLSGRDAGGATQTVATVGVAGVEMPAHLAFGWTGTAPAAFSLDANCALYVDIVNAGFAITGGTVNIGNFPATQDVAVATLPLPANAAQETGGNLAASVAALNTVVTKLTSIISALGNPAQAGGAVTVSNLPAVQATKQQDSAGNDATDTTNHAIRVNVVAEGAGGGATAANQAAVQAAPGSSSADAVDVQGVPGGLSVPVSAAANAFGAGAIFDLGTGPTPGANTTNGLLGAIKAALNLGSQALGNSLAVTDLSLQSGGPAMNAIMSGVGTPGGTTPTTALYFGCLPSSSEPSAQTTNTFVGAWCDLNGKQIMVPYAPRQLRVSGTATTTAATATSLITAPGSGQIFVTDIECWRTDAGATPITLTLNDASSSVIILLDAGYGGRGDLHTKLPLQIPATTALTFTPSAATTSVVCDAQGFVG